jgi:magnesium transporter
MLRVLRKGEAHFDVIERLTPGWRLPPDAVWIDLVSPSREEELAVEAAVGVPVPTREEMVEIEVSSRLYKEGGATFMTASVVTNAEGDLPASEPVTFVLVRDWLITIRYAEPRAFTNVIGQIERQPAALGDNGADAFVMLLDAIVDRLADVLERANAEVELASRSIFTQPRAGGFEAILTRLGRTQNVTAKVRDSLVSLSRLLSFSMLAEQIGVARDCREHLRSQQRDVASLTDHASYLSNNITFLLDAALGLINIEQNSIIKIFSVGAVCLMPPTLVASVYGMNFRHIPELEWMAGYPLALAMMIVSGLVPLWWFKRKGWL